MKKWGVHNYCRHLHVFLGDVLYLVKNSSVWEL